MFIQKLEYIHNNPVRPGYVDELAHWRYFSYRNYMELPSLLEVELIYEILRQSLLIAFLVSD
jgi:hypothetical protein